MSKINGIGIGVSYGNSSGSGSLIDSSTFFAPLKTSLILTRGTGDPTWSRATKAWGFNELGYLEELASGCAFFGGARLVRNLLAATEDSSSGSWAKSTGTTAAQATDSGGGSTAMRFTYGSSQSYLMRQSPSLPSRESACCLQFRFKTDATHDWWRVMIYDGSGNQCRAWFNAQTGTVGNTVPNGSGVFVSATLTDVGGGWFDFKLIGSPGVAGVGGVYMQFSANDGDGSALISTVASGDAITIEKPSLVDVTGYDASYVPEYVSVGVESSPYFGAGIDGAKYFETDWQGAPIAAANLLGFRREASAINNVRFSRNLYGSTYTELGSTSTPKVWEPSTTGSSLVTNGTFDTDLTGWTNNGASSASVASGKMRIDSTGGNGGRYQDLTLTIGKTYYISADATLISGSGTLLLTIYGSTAFTGEVKQTWLSSSGSYGTIFKATATTQRLYLSVISALVADFDNVVVKECTCVPERTATGLDGIANTATTLTATAADAIILQPISLVSAARCASAYIKRRTGSGTISFTQDGGSTWTDITAQINSSTWSRVQITSTLANPSVGFKISTSGDAIDVDCVQNEAGAVATSPIITTTAAITRNADSLTYQTASNIDFAVGTLYCETQFTAAISTRRAVAIGADGWSYINTGDANTIWKAYDGTNIVTKSGLSDISTAKRKRVVSWGTGLKVTGDGLSPASGSFDGSLGSGASIEIGQFINGYIGPVAIYNYQMTDAQLQAITS